jgi:predicted DCC family thiol-disulfide oxidoreductase YuxK
MRSLTVLYDNDCGLCCRAVRRLINEPTYLPLRFAPGRAAQVRERFAAAFAAAGDDQLIVVADSGELYKGPAAWIMVLYALRRYRPLAMRLASPGLRPLVSRVVGVIARNRLAISEVFGLSPDACILAEARGERASGPNSAGSPCAGGACERPATPPLTDSRTEDSITRLDALIKARQRVRAGWGPGDAAGMTPPPIPS